MKPIRSILFVCTANACRSPMAEAIARWRLQQKGVKNIKVFSRGTDTAPSQQLSPHAGWALTESQIPFSGHVPKRLTRKDVTAAGLILTMAQDHRDAIRKLAPRAYNKTFLLHEYADQVTRDVADPIGKPLDDFRQCRDELVAAIDKVLIPIAKPEGAKREKRPQKTRSRTV